MLAAAMTSTPTRRVGSFGRFDSWLFRGPDRDRSPGTGQNVSGRPFRGPAIIRGVIPQVLVLAGLVALATGWLTLRRFGSGIRIGRLLAATTVVPVAEAVRIGRAGTRRYVGVRGRIEADDEFEDEHHRPLVFRRARLEAATGRGWRRLDESREVVGFRISEGADTIGVDGPELEEGLVVVLRESVGTAADVPGRVPEDLPPDTAIRLRIEQVSSVEHAIVLGLPVADADEVTLRPGLGRPLVLTTLEPPEAMRLLGRGRRRTALSATLLLAGGLAAVGVGGLWALAGAFL
jgi:hypothetical protein